MLAPAVMINACGLLLLGINNKYSAMMSRIRMLNEEKRRYMNKVKDNKDLDYLETTRFQSIVKQIKVLLSRLRLIRNSILSLTIGLFLFILTSILIGIEALVGLNVTKYIFIATFALGMILVAIGLVYLLKDTMKGYNIINLDIKADE